MSRAALLLSLVLLAGCSGRVAPPAVEFPCDTAGDPHACAWCIAHPPRGAVDAPICQTSVDGPAGATCCSHTRATTDGGIMCEATFFDGEREFANACGAAQ